MANPSPATIVLLLSLISAYYSSLATASGDNNQPTSDLVSHLQSLQSQSDTGVIHLTDPLLRRILSLPSPRPFSFLVFFDAQQLHSKPELSLPSLKAQYALLSKSFCINHPSDSDSDSHSKLFFLELEFQESQPSFAVFGVNALPHIKLVPGSAVDVKNGSYQMEASDFSRLAESMSDFVESKTKIKIGPIYHPPIVSKKQMLFVIALILICTPFVIKRVLSGNTFLHDKYLWMGGAVFVYFFSVSGTMHNIIRKMPLFLEDRNNPGQLIFFYQGSGMQLGAEGFFIGFLYTIVGLFLAFVTHALPSIRNKTVQRGIMIFVLLVSFWAVGKVIYLDNWKTGYGIHAYWPSSWK